MLSLKEQYHFMTSSDRFPVPVRSAVKSIFTDWCCQNLSKRALNALTVHQRLNVQKLIINVNKRVYYEKITNVSKRRQQTLTLFQTVCKLCIEYFCSSFKFEIPVRSCSNQQKIRSPTVTTKFYWSKRQWVAVESAGLCASLQLAPGR